MISVIPIMVYNMLLAMGAIHPAAVCTYTTVEVHGHRAPAMACSMPAELEEEPVVEVELEPEPDRKAVRGDERKGVRPSRRRR